jgi:hypothetical protein
MTFSIGQQAESLRHPYGVEAVSHPEFSVDVFQMLVHRTRRQGQVVPDRLCRPTFGEQDENGQLATGEAALSDREWQASVRVAQELDLAIETDDERL